MPRRFKLVALVALSTVVGACLAEVGVRLRQRVRYGTARVNLSELVRDPRSGLLIPQSGWQQGSIRINSLGFRSPELAVPKPAGRIRMAFLGGSTTYCAEVSSQEKTWPHLVWRAVQEKYPEQTIDYVNAGVSGYILNDLLQNLVSRVRPLQPDVVVIYEATNDISFDTRRLAEEQALDIGRRGTPSFMGQYLLAWNLVEFNLDVLLSKAHARQGTTARKLQFDERVLARGFSDRLDKLVREAQKNSLVVLVTFSRKPRRTQTPEQQLDASNTALYYMPYMTVEGLFRVFDAYNEAIRNVATVTGALLVDDENSIPGDDQHFTDSVHLTDAGAEKMAARVVSRLATVPRFSAR